jgi:hypothetical protein
MIFCCICQKIKEFSYLSNQSINAKSAKNTTAATKNFGQFFQQYLPILGKL